MLTVIGLLSASFGMAVASALLPLISVEIFVVGLMLKDPAVPWWPVALVVAVGQISGKLLYFYAARGVIRLPGFLHRRTVPGNTAPGSPTPGSTVAGSTVLGSHVPDGGSQGVMGRWRNLLERFRENCRNRPLWAGAILLLSATASLPPFLATCVVAGWARIPLTTFLITGFAGRFVRFGLLAIAPGVLVAWV